MEVVIISIQGSFLAWQYGDYLKILCRAKHLDKRQLSWLTIECVFIEAHVDLTIQSIFVFFTKWEKKP